MDSTKKEEVFSSISSLDTIKTQYVLGRILEFLENDSKPLVKKDEIEESARKDRILLQDVSQSLKMSLSDKEPEIDAARNFLLVLAKQNPKIKQTIIDSIAESNIENVSLSPTLDPFALKILVIAISAAIVRPRITYTEKKRGAFRRKKVEVEIQGVDDIVEVIKTTLPFLKK